MKSCIIPFVLLMALTCHVSCRQPAAENFNVSYGVIPEPSYERLEDGSFTFTDKSVIYYGDSLENVASLLAELVKESCGYELQTRPVGLFAKMFSSDAIFIEADRIGSSPEKSIPSDVSEEGYSVVTRPGRIVIKGNTARGCIHGTYFLRKVWDDEMAVPCGVVNDSPRFRYRGVMLDVGRHMFSIDEIKRYVDVLALHNINVFHWHLTEDQGWRIEIRSRPLLTETGSVRKGTMVGKDYDSCDGVPYGGYYTQEQAEEIVRYAALRGITVIPEIDIPGHTLAALSSYPELGCKGGGYEVWTRWGVSEDVLCPGKESTFDFLDEVFGELSDVFPSEYIHIGGDECPKVRWKDCPDCQKKIDELGLEGDSLHTAEEKLQAYVVRHVAGFLKSLGRKAIGWDETLEGNPGKDLTIMCWRDPSIGAGAAEAGHDVIMTPIEKLYFSRYQSPDIENEPLGPGGLVTVESVYGYDFMDDIPEGSEARSHVLGGQASIWTEYIGSYDHLMYMTLPRLASLSEMLWSSGGHDDYSEFMERLRRMIEVYDEEGCNYAKHCF